MPPETLKTIQDNFVQELQSATSGKKSSLPFIKHQLPSQPLVKDNEFFEVLVIGGSISRRAIVKKNQGTIKIITHRQKDQPIFRTKDTFLRFVEQELSTEVSVLAVNFAYPLSPVYTDSKLEGVLISGSKTNAFEGMVGKNVCKEIEEYVFQKRGQRISVTIANDTICLLLSGLTEIPWKNLACGIVGTGVNFAIFLDEKNVVNLESANFDKFPKTFEGKRVDELSLLPGKSLFEKETSGGYLYKYFNEKVKITELPPLSIDSTKELTILAQENNSPYTKIAVEVLCSSAQLVATQIAGIAIFLQKDLTFIMEGSLFWEGYKYKSCVEKALKELELPYKVSFRHIHNSYIVGAAKLVC